MLREYTTLCTFFVSMNRERILSHSFYFHALQEFEGPTCWNQVWLPPLMSITQYSNVFQLLSRPISYDDLIQQLLNYFKNKRSPQSLIEFAVYYFLNEQFLPDLVRISISRNVYISHGIIAWAINITGCFAQMSSHGAGGGRISLLGGSPLHTWYPWIATIKWSAKMKNCT